MAWISAFCNNNNSSSRSRSCGSWSLEEGETIDTAIRWMMYVLMLCIKTRNVLDNTQFSIIAWALNLRKNPRFAACTHTQYKRVKNYMCPCEETCIKAGWSKTGGCSRERATKKASTFEWVPHIKVSECFFRDSSSVKCDFWIKHALFSHCECRQI